MTLLSVIRRSTWCCLRETGPCSVRSRTMRSSCAERSLWAWLRLGRAQRGRCARPQRGRQNLPRSRVGDIDVEENRVWLHGSTRLDERWGELTEWGRIQIRRHLNTISPTSETLLIDGGRPGTSIAQSSAVGVIGRTLRRAGLGEDPAVRPSSIAAWAGRRLFDSSGHIDLVARRLGMRSLDRTAIFIGWDWPHDDR